MEENSLQHHGIDGMHWGVRNGPPYPLDKKTKAKVYGNHGEIEPNFSKREQKQNAKSYSGAVSEYWKMVKQDPYNVEDSTKNLDYMTDNCPVIKAIRSSKEYNDYVDSIDDYRKYMKENFYDNPDGQEKARKYKAQYYIDSPDYPEIKTYKDAVDRFGSYLDEDLNEAFEAMDKGASRLDEVKIKAMRSALAKANEISERYLGDYYTGFNNPAVLTILGGLPLRKLHDDNSDKVKHSDEDELQHWGILGMKWGIRRYQNYDGTYTKAGKLRKRMDIEGESNPELDKHREDQPSSVQTQSNNPQEKRSNLYVNKPVSELTDQELRDFLTRVDMERRYNEYINSMAPKIDPVEKEIKDLRNQLEIKNLNNQLNPKKEKKPSVVMEIVGPALKSVASQFVKNKLEDALLKKTEDPVKKQIDNLKKKVEIKELNDRLNKKSDDGNKPDKELDSLKRKVEIKELNDRLNKKSDEKDPRDSYIKELETEWKIGNLKSKIAGLNKSNSSDNTNNTSKQPQKTDSDSDVDLYSEVHNFLSGHRAARTASSYTNTNNTQSTWQQSFDSLFTPYNSAMGSNSSSQSFWSRPLEGFSTSSSSSKGSSWLDRYIERTTRKIG